jgi:hypothetical protein
LPTSDTTTPDTSGGLPTNTATPTDTPAAPTVVDQTTDPATGNTTTNYSDGTTTVTDANGNAVDPNATPTTTSDTSSESGTNLGGVLSTVLGAIPALYKNSSSSGSSSSSGTTTTTTPTGTTSGGLSVVTPTTTPTTTTSTKPKATMIKGTQIALPEATSYSVPVDTYQTPAANPNLEQFIQTAANGGLMSFAGGGDVNSPPTVTMHPLLMHGHQFNFTQPHVGLNPLSDAPAPVFHHKAGGQIHEHHPEFFSEGGLGAIQHTYVTGKGDGTSDSIPAMLANGEFVIPADVVSSLGNGSNDSGAKVLDEFLKTIREHKRKADAKHLPPDSKGPLGYLLDAKKRVRA